MAWRGLPGMGQQTFPALPALASVGFLSFVGLHSKLCPQLCLLGVIQCDLEKKSVDHSLKTGQK